jgi:alpha-galactosidase
VRRSAGLLVLVLALVSASGVPADSYPPATLPASTVRTPPMGWDSWNTFGCDIDEAKIRTVADALVSSGMRDAGYRYVVVDDCWYQPERGPDGNLQANKQRFPSGMAALGNYLHARGLKFGLYMSPNSYTCAQYGGAYPGRTGSGGHENQDARTFASWGVDYLKYDWCFAGGTVDGERTAFRTMRDALADTGRPIVYGINPNSNFPGVPGETRDWCGVAQLARTTQDIQPVWDGGSRDAAPMGIRNIIDVNAALTTRSAPGCWNDADMLEIGVHGVDGYPGLTPDEARTHLSMWAMLAAPLIAGNDPNSMTEQDRQILTAPGVLAVDQDPIGRAATRIAGGAHQVWTRPLVSGTAVALYNSGNQAAPIMTTLHDLGLPPGRYEVRDLWSAARSTTDDTIAASVPAHGTVLLHLRRS